MSGNGPSIAAGGMVTLASSGTSSQVSTRVARGASAELDAVRLRDARDLPVEDARHRGGARRRGVEENAEERRPGTGKTMRVLHGGGAYCSGPSLPAGRVGEPDPGDGGRGRE